MNDEPKQNDILTESHEERNQLILDQVEKNLKAPPQTLAEAMEQYQLIKQKSLRADKVKKK